MPRSEVEEGRSEEGSIVSGNRGTRLRLPPSWSWQARSPILHAVSLARVALLAATDRVATSVRLEHELALLLEELRIKDARLERVPPHRRPHYPAVERLAILELRAARGWSAAQPAERFFVTEATVASWMMRLDEDGPSALVRTLEPVNRFPDLVAHLVRRLAAGQVPRYLITDRGREFPATSFRRGCRRAGVRQRFGAIGKHGSIALVERCILTVKEVGVRRWLSPIRW
jgi:transposase InsO family protein